jgi:hypothetical protein
MLMLVFGVEVGVGVVESTVTEFAAVAGVASPGMVDVVSGRLNESVTLQLQLGS